MRRKDIRKRKGIRYAEYYNMVEIQDELYRQGMMKKKFYHLMPIIASPQNIRLAYRNLKNNKGSNTPGVDGKTFADYAKLEDVELIRKVQEFYLRKTGCYKKPCLDKINRWRASANLPAITL